MTGKSGPEWRKKWSIGIYTGPSPLNLSAPPAMPQPVFTGERMSGFAAASVADPFLYRHDGAWHLFFEVWNGDTGRGEIAHASSADARQWSSGELVLREPFHLSYPCVFPWDGEAWMIPETRQAHSIRLYRADPFPSRWRFMRTVVEGPFADSTIFRHENWWWMFAQRGLDELRLFFSETPGSAWREHPASPVRAGNRRLTRPGGRVVCDGERLLRFAQDGLPSYGHSVRAVEILALTPARYEEREVSESPILRPSGQGWNGVGMHHVDAQRLDDGSWLAAVDGATQAFY